MKNKIQNILKTVWEFIVNPRLLLCFGLAWIITNGWSYVMLVIGTYFRIEWMIAVAGGYLAFLWLPVSPEKIVTVAITIALLRFLFPNDKRTLGKLKALREKIRMKNQERKAKKETQNDNESDET
ncbi:MAG: hypothetical protein E7616_05360 [Ruminococcaceae bacterium]|nr:hypothetical protein [Oscillospiraceae bacterium]